MSVDGHMKLDQADIDFNTVKKSNWWLLTKCFFPLKSMNYFLGDFFFQVCFLLMSLKHQELL